MQKQQAVVEDADTLALLQQMEAVYKAMQSYSVRVEYTRDDANTRKKAAAPRLLDLRFRRPNYLAIRDVNPLRHSNWTQGYGMEWEERRTDGKELVLLASFGKVYARFPLEATGTAFGVLSGSSLTLSELQWLGSLFSPEGLLAELWRHGYGKVSRGHSFLLNYTPMQTVIARTDAKAQREPSELILTVGTDDHRLYQTQRIDHSTAGDSIEAITYHNLQVTPVLAASLFAAPADWKRLYSIEVLAVTPQTILLSNRERKARVGDHVLLFQGGGFTPYVAGEVVISKVKKDHCEAEALMNAAIRPGRHGFLLPRQ